MKKNKKKKFKILNILLILSIIILLGSISIFYYVYNNNIKLNKELNITNNNLLKQQDYNESLKNKLEEIENKIEETKNNKKEELKELEVWKKMEERLK